MFGRQVCQQTCWRKVSIETKIVELVSQNIYLLTSESHKSDEKDIFIIIFQTIRMTLGHPLDIEGHGEDVEIKVEVTTPFPLICPPLQIPGGSILTMILFLPRVPLT